MSFFPYLLQGKNSLEKCEYRISESVIVACFAPIIKLYMPQDQN